MQPIDLIISPPGYFHHNFEIKKKVLWSSRALDFDLEYQIDNFLTIGNEYCNPELSYNRDECVTKQMLNVKTKELKPKIIFNYRFSAFSRNVWMPTTFHREV